ncbi:peptidoglycan DD-metalloendopeptidase family protein [Hoeflea sp. YIM 152468]|uniref:murein hydrolase activator EnvC family protein n=1 Tax=Hoeflea sp. YIM 152468 TaxID=3031759 RepID=UPI0023DAB349|nr:peptidoglycan DD-metalloendopeptidase family protein [Hoeflea sp. YIM 152468]MDF1609176.1 peptidoglycan DD-metalloendopeptidase family protein [Hoeflea sp. YIM 152468]
MWRASSVQPLPGATLTGINRCMPRKRALRGSGSLVLIASVFLITFATPVYATEPGVPGSPDVGSDLERERQASTAELQTVAEQAALAAKALTALEQDIVALRADQQALDEKIAQAAASRAMLDEQISAGEQSMTGLSERQEAVRLSLISRRSILAEVLAALQRIGRDPPPALLVSPEDALSSVRSAILLGAVVPEIRAETEALAGDLKELAALREAIALERQSLTAALARNEAEEQRLAELASEKTALQAESQRRLDRERERAEALSVRSAELESVIATLAGEIVSLRQAAEAAQKAEQERQRQLAEKLERARAFAAVAVPDKNRIMPAYNFSKLHGTLSRPAKGETLRYFGADDGTGHTLAGEILATEAGATIVAPADAWIAYAGPFRSYGQVVILETGEDHHVVLAGMEKVNVAAGRFVVSGEPLATMGQTRFAGSAALTLASERPTLYIEFRKDGQPVDPRAWWKDAMSSRRATNDT